jgi:hypothetical protein
MNRKQFVASAFAAAIPAYLLVASMVWALFQGGMLGDEAKVSAALWVVFVIAALSGIIIGVLPFAIVIFPGLYPIAAAASGSASATTAAPGRKTQDENLEDESAEPLDEEFGGQDEIDSYADDFDEFAEDVQEEEPPQTKKKGHR